MSVPFFHEIRAAAGLRPLLHGLRDGATLLAFLLGGIALIIPARTMPSLWHLVIAALTEELTFRTMLQSQLERCIPRQWGSVSAGMLITSALFALSHMFTQPAGLAILTFFPSLVFGILWTRHRSLWLCALVHFWYNLLLFL